MYLTHSRSDRPVRNHPYDARLQTPFAVLGVRTAGDCLIELEMLPLGAETLKPQNAFAREVCQQLRAYLKNARFEFDLPYWQDGTEFQQRAWRAVQDIPVGKVRSYGEIAKALRSGPRAIGGICGANQIPLIIPCHRVVSASGIGGYMHVRAGHPLAIKRWLLAHEGVEFK